MSYILLHMHKNVLVCMSMYKLLFPMSSLPQKISSLSDTGSYGSLWGLLTYWDLGPILKEVLQIGKLLHIRWLQMRKIISGWHVPSNIFLLLDLIQFSLDSASLSMLPWPKPAVWPLVPPDASSEVLEKEKVMISVATLEVLYKCTW